MNDLQGLIKQCHRDTQRWFPDVAENIAHMTLGLCGESGEVAELVKKIDRGSFRLDQVMTDKIGEECIDVLIYLCNILAILDIDAMEVYKQKRAKNEYRFAKPGDRDITARVGGNASIGEHIPGDGRHAWGAC